MTTSTLATKWGSDTVAVTADWSEMDGLIDGLDGYQVASVGHSPLAALRIALEQCARSEGMDLEEEETQDLIESALDAAQ